MTSAAFVLIPAFVLALTASCGLLSDRDGSGILVEIPAEVIDRARGAAGDDISTLTLKVRIRALDPEALPPGIPIVLNDMPEQQIRLCRDPEGATLADCNNPNDSFEGRRGWSIRIAPEKASAYAGIAVGVHLALFVDDVVTVGKAFSALDDLGLLGLDCVSYDCGHLPLSALTPIAARSFRLEVLGESDADVVMFPLESPDGTFFDLDGDTFAGADAVPGGGCHAFLANFEGACESIQDDAFFDCDDRNLAANTFELEQGILIRGICLDGIDQNCDEIDGPCGDGDSDGFIPPEDCNDSDPDINPGVTENGATNCSDGIDQNCDGADVECDCDTDGDDFCPMPVGGLPGGDCCDDVGDPGCTGMPPIPAGIFPNAADVCGNGIDENCDGTDAVCGLADGDGDGHCSTAYDCGSVDCDTIPPAAAASAPICCLMRTMVDLSACGDVFDDCEDADAGIHPDRTEVCGNGVDDDCDPSTSDACNAADLDGDGFTPADGDCGEGDAMVYPGAPEVCSDGIDNDCAGGDVTCSPAVDSDGDTHVACLPGNTINCDCDDTDAAIHPYAPELCDSLDNDCNGLINDGNPGGSSGGTPDVCYGNPPGATPMYVEMPGDETWRCRTGKVSCTIAGALVCIEFVPPLVPGAMDCEEDTLCNGRNDVCVPCVGGELIRAAERDEDGDACFACNAPDLDPMAGIVTGDMCGGVDCCDDGTKAACQGQPPATIYYGAIEDCGNMGIDNDCDGDAGENCSAGMGTELCNGLDDDCDCISDASDPDAQNDCTVVGEYCDGFSCVPGCIDVTDCTNSNMCDMGTNQCVCGVGPGCTGGLTCTGGVCLCGGSACGPGEVCISNDCTCGGTVASFGEACPNSSPNPMCIGMACVCDANSTCDSNETCSSGSCTCASFMIGAGPACPDSSPNPICGGAGCRCTSSGGVCDADETCSGGNCNCGGTSSSSGPVCSDSSPNPNCVAGNCACDSDSVCAVNETCSGGRCWCDLLMGGTSGPACAPPSICDAPTSTCFTPCFDNGDCASGWQCNTSFGLCECNGNNDCNGSSQCDQGQNPNVCNNCGGDCAPGENCTSGSCACEPGNVCPP